MALMPCLSSRVVSDLNASIRVSNAASQLAVPLTTTTFLGVSANSSPKGSAVWTLAAGGGGAGTGAFSAVGVSAGDLVSAGGGTGTAEGAGLGEAEGLGAGEAVGAGDWARAAPVNATMESAARAARKVLIRFISGILHPPHPAAACPGPRPPKWCQFLTCKVRFRPMTDASYAPARFCFDAFSSREPVSTSLENA